METQVKIDSSLLLSAMKMGHFRSKKELVEKAVKEFIKNSQRKQMLDFAGKNVWDGNLDEMRDL